MISGEKPGKDIFFGEENIIVFAINTEGFNDSGFAGLVSRKGWPELANMGECELGSVYAKEIDGKRFCGIVCHSLEKGWGTPEEQTAIIKKCFDKIETKEGEEIASIAIGNGMIGKLSGADYEAITLGMSQSEKEVVLYGEIPEKVLQAQEESKISLENVEVPEYIKKISEIKKDELTEREFYEKILEQIKVSEDLTPETAKMLKETLKSIGCKEYKEWKAEKIANGEEVKEGLLSEGIDNGDISAAVSMVSQFFYGFDSVLYGRSKMLDGGENYGWLQTWLRNSKEKTAEKGDDKIKKLNVPYYKVAKEALMNWNGLSKEEAEKIIVDSTFDEVEGQVWAKGSMDYAIAEISKALSLTEGDVEKITKEIYEGSDTSHVLRALKPEMERIGANPDEIIMDTLFAVHNGWVKDNEKKFMAREKKHQHMPSELIGWKEAKADLLFIKPIFEAAGIEVSEERLESVYNSRVEEFFLMKGIRTKEDLAREIAKGEEFYSALKGQDTILEFLKDEENVETILIPQIEDKGIGSIEKTWEKIIKRIEDEPKQEDLQKLNREEQEKIIENLNSKIQASEAERDSIKQKNKLINDILAKSEKLSSIREEILKAQNETKNFKEVSEEE